jgi:hypothetical protein
MTPPMSPGPLCPICSQPLTPRERAPEQRWMETEYVCLDIDCLEFGIYRASSSWPQPSRR